MLMKPILLKSRLRKTKYGKSLLVFGVALLFVVPKQAIAQNENSWKDLADVTFNTKMDSSGKYPIQYPVFGEKVKALSGKEITLKGFVVPLETLQGDNYFVLSMLPFNICYFCGGAGPETVVQVYTEHSYPPTEESVLVTGILRINDADPEQLMYVLENASVTVL